MLVIVGVLIFIHGFISTKTVLDCHMYAVGDNCRAAIPSDISTRHVGLLLLARMGFLSAVATVCVLPRLTSATVRVGMEFRMDTTATCFTGGTAAIGSIGTILDAVIGVFVMGVTNQGLSTIGVDAAVAETIKDLVLLLVAVMDIMSKRKKS